MELFRYEIAGNGGKGALHIRPSEYLNDAYLWEKNLKWLKVPRLIIDTHKAETYEFWFKRRGARIFRARCLPYYKRGIVVLMKKSSTKRIGLDRVLYEDEYQVVIRREEL